MTQQIPLLAKPAQRLNVQLGGQACSIRLRQLRSGLFLDLWVAGSPIALGVQCRDRTWIVRSAGAFAGDMTFIDTLGSSDPDYTGLAYRFQLIWTAP